MAEDLKSLFNPAMIGEMAGHLARQSPSFDADGFAAMATAGLEALEFKQRSAQIARALGEHLPREFPVAAALMVAALHPETGPDLSSRRMDAGGIRGWAVLPMTQYVADHGLDHFDPALDALGEMTRRLTAEFAVRPFILRDQHRAMARIERWARDPDPHLRRLASEGTRPRLPWGARLRPFIADPSPILPILRSLRDDPSDYVRRSVANNLNDIAKDHPDLVADLALDWLTDAPPARRRLVAHACRSLVKAGHAPTLCALGFEAPLVRLDRLGLSPSTVRFGEALTIAASLRSTSASDQRILLDYALHHVKANGTTRPKVFKWRSLTLPAGAAITVTRTHPLRPITTRVYHDGTHSVEILVNGASLGQASFELTGTGDQRVGTGTSPR